MNQTHFKAAAIILIGTAVLRSARKLRRFLLEWIDNNLFSAADLTSTERTRHTV